MNVEMILITPSAFLSQKEEQQRLIFENLESNNDIIMIQYFLFKTFDLY